MPQVIIVSLVASLLIGLFGANRKLGFWGYFFGSLLFTPFIGLVLLLASDRRNPEK
jgi:uncharacterized membrane protein YiaA